MRILLHRISNAHTSSMFFGGTKCSSRHSVLLLHNACYACNANYRWQYWWQFFVPTGLHLTVTDADLWTEVGYAGFCLRKIQMFRNCIKYIYNQKLVGCVETIIILYINHYQTSVFFLLSDHNLCFIAIQKYENFEQRIIYRNLMCNHLFYIIKSNTSLYICSFLCSS